MKLHYHPETDSLSIELRSVPSRETREVVSGVNVDLGEDGAVVGFDNDFASATLGPSTLETEALQ